MKLLLTSGGLTNNSIKTALLELAGRPPEKIKLAFIPTAANIEEGNKTDWFFLQYEELRAAGITWIDMVDFAAADIDWRSRLNVCDVLYVSGGNTFYLLDQMRKQRFGDYFKDVCESKLYVGCSAGSIVTTSTIEVATIPPGDPNIPGLKDLTGLSYIDFEIEPHCNETRFAAVEKYAKNKSRKVYAIDDATAIKYVDGKVTVISEGEWRIF